MDRVPVDILGHGNRTRTMFSYVRYIPHPTNRADIGCMCWTNQVHILPFALGINECLLFGGYQTLFTLDSGQQLLMKNSWIFFDDTVARLSFATLSITSQCGIENIRPFTEASVSLLHTWRFIPKLVLTINLAEILPTWAIVPSLVLAINLADILFYFTLSKPFINQSINQELTKRLFDILSTFVSTCQNWCVFQGR